MTNTELYINELAELYNVSEKDKLKMSDGYDQIEASLGKYYWEDIKHAIQVFYARKNDKSRPRLSQILALLETDRNITQKEPYVEPADPVFRKPTTKLWSISNTFNKMINVLIDGGVIPNEQGEYNNIRSLVNPQTDDVILNPMQWLKWQLSDAMAARPDIFTSIPVKTFYEHLALAIQNNLITFKVRDWSKLTGGNK